MSELSVLLRSKEEAVAAGFEVRFIYPLRRVKENYLIHIYIYTYFPSFFTIFMYRLVLKKMQSSGSSSIKVTSC